MSALSEKLLALMLDPQADLDQQERQLTDLQKAFNYHRMEKRKDLESRKNSSLDRKVRQCLYIYLI